MNILRPPMLFTSLPAVGSKLDICLLPEMEKSGDDGRSPPGQLVAEEQLFIWQWEASPQTAPTYRHNFDSPAMVFVMVLEQRKATYATHVRDMRGRAFSSGAGRGQKCAGRGRVGQKNA